MFNQDNQQILLEFHQAIKRNPSNPNAYYNRGETYYNLGNYQESLADFDKAISLEPTNAFFYFNRGLTNIELQDYQKALADFDKAISLESTMITSVFYPNTGSTVTYDKKADFYIQRGQTYRALRDNRKAMADFEQAISIHPDSAEAYCRRGELYLLEFGNSSEAQNLVKKL